MLTIYEFATRIIITHLFQWCSFNKNALSRHIIFDHWPQEGNFVTPAPKIGKF